MTSRRISAYARAVVWSVAMTSPPASDMPPLRCPVSRRSAAASTAGIHSPPGSSAVRQARAVCSAVSGSPSRAVISSPALVRQLDVPGVGEEHHRPDHAVGQRLGVAVGVVGAAAQQALAVRRVVDERDRVVVAAERRPGQREPARRGRERLAHPLAPRARVARVVHLVEDHQRAPGLGAVAVQHRVGGDAGVGDRDAGVVRRRGAGRVAEVRVQRDPDRRRGRRPLVLEVLGRGDDGDRGDRPVGEQLRGHPQREGGLAGTRRRDGEEVLRPRRQVAGQRAALPGAERAAGRRAPCPARRPRQRVARRWPAGRVRNGRHGGLGHTSPGGSAATAGPGAAAGSGRGGVQGNGAHGGAGHDPRRRPRRIGASSPRTIHCTPQRHHASRAQVPTGRTLDARRGCGRASSGASRPGLRARAASILGGAMTATPPRCRPPPAGARHRGARAGAGPHAGQGVGRRHLLDGRAGRVLAGAVAAAAVPGPAGVAGLRRRLVRAGDRRHRRGQDRRVRPADLHPRGRRPAHRPDGGEHPHPGPRRRRVGRVPHRAVGGVVGDRVGGRLDHRGARPVRGAPSGVAAPVLAADLPVRAGGGRVHAAGGRAGPGPAAARAARGVAADRGRGRRDLLLPGRRARCWWWCSPPSTGPRCRTARRGGGCCPGRCWRWWSSSRRRPGCGSTSPC